MKVRIKLDTMTDIKNFVDICTKITEPVKISDNAGHCVSAKSMLGMLYTMEWSEVWCECETDVYSKIKSFVI